MTSDKRVVAVTVTFGDREELLRQTVTAALTEGADRVIVVDNASTWNVASVAQLGKRGAIHVLRLDANCGSAGGYAAGIAHAVDSGSELIWLLDDDNVPYPGTLRRLIEAYTCLQAQHGPSDLAVLGFRPEHQADAASALARHRINARRSSFRGFHILDIPFKLWRRVPWARRSSPKLLSEVVALDSAPYSGLLFHRSLVEKIGLPRSDFVLYGDDTEFTYRITMHGGRILLITDARIEDLESSWNAKHRFSNSFIGLLRGTGDARAYYAMRNGAYLDTHCLPHNPTFLSLNRWAFVAILFLFSKATRRGERYRLLVTAIRDGMSGSLGVNKDFPL